MKIYIDYIFIENLLIMYVLLKECGMLTNKKIKKLNHIICCIISAVYVCVMVIFKIRMLNYAILKILLGVVIVYIAFLPKRLSQYLKLIGIYFLTSIINLGVFYITRNLFKIGILNFLYKILIYTINLLLCMVVCKKMWKLYTLTLTQNTLIYDVKVVIGNKEYKYKGFMDTGNSAYNFENNIPIIIAEVQDNIQKEKIKKLDNFLMPISSINSESEQRVYIPTKFVINSEEINVGIVFLEKKLDSCSNYNMILNFEMFKNNMRGICV